MKSRKEAHQKMENLLIRAYREKERAKVGEQWQKNLMSHIRSLGPLNSKTNFFELLEPFVWRFAPVACVLILVLTICFINLDFVPEYEMAKTYIEDPIEFTFLQSFGV